MSAPAGPVRIAPEVAAAIADGTPVVAMETSFLAHGLPPPENLDTALSMEAAIRAAGAVPATIGIVEGTIWIGLERGQLEHFALRPDTAKASRRDLGPLVAFGRSGATTVAATIACAARVGIRIMATGGIGGVHRGEGATLDVSADLRELGATPVALVCSGAKSILDLRATVEVLETEGVPLVGYRVDRLPAFHLRSTEIALEHRVADPQEAARVVSAHFALARGGLVLANPVPAARAVAPDDFAEWLARAEARARSGGIVGKALTPYLLARLGELSEGATLAANVGLLVENARVAGLVAAALAAIDR